MYTTRFTVQIALAPLRHFLWPVSRMKLLHSFLAVVPKYLLVVIGSTMLLLILGLVAGYMPYGDVPGPGWQEWPWEIRLRITGRNLPILLLFSAATSVAAAGTFLLPFLTVHWLAVNRTPQLLVTVLGGTLTGMTTGWSLLFTGSYLSMSLAVLAIGTALGVYFGAAQLPRVTSDIHSA